MLTLLPSIPNRNRRIQGSELYPPGEAPGTRTCSQIPHFNSINLVAVSPKQRKEIKGTVKTPGSDDHLFQGAEIGRCGESRAADFLRHYAKLERWNLRLSILHLLPFRAIERSQYYHRSKRSPLLPIFLDTHCEAVVIESSKPSKWILLRSMVTGPVVRCAGGVVWAKTWRLNTGRSQWTPIGFRPIAIFGRHFVLVCLCAALFRTRSWHKS